MYTPFGSKYLAIHPYQVVPLLAFAAAMQYSSFCFPIQYSSYPTSRSACPRRSLIFGSLQNQSRIVLTLTPVGLESSCWRSSQASRRRRDCRFLAFLFHKFATRIRGDMLSQLVRIVVTGIVTTTSFSGRKFEKDAISRRQARHDTA